MQILFSFILLFSFIAESLLFIFLVVQGKDIDDSYFRKYAKNNLFLFTLTKASIVAVVIYIILLSEGLVGSGRFAAYIMGALYCFVSFRFIRKCILYWKAEA